MVYFPRVVETPLIDMPLRESEASVSLCLKNEQAKKEGASCAASYVDSPCDGLDLIRNPSESRNLINILKVSFYKTVKSGPMRSNTKQYWKSSALSHCQCLPFSGSPSVSPVLRRCQPLSFSVIYPSSLCLSTQSSSSHFLSCSYHKTAMCSCVLIRPQSFRLILKLSQKSFRNHLVI